MLVPFYFGCGGAPPFIQTMFMCQLQSSALGVSGENWPWLTFWYLCPGVQLVTITHTLMDIFNSDMSLTS